MHYLLHHLPTAWALTVIHLRLSLVPVLAGLVLAVPWGVLTWRIRALRRFTTVAASAIFTIPSLALFVVLPLIIPTRILDEANVLVALTLYTSALLVRAVFEALDAVPAQVRDAASAVGYRPIAQNIESRTAAVDSGAGRRSARGRRHQHLDGLGGCGDRHRRPGDLVHRGLSGQQERPDRGRNHRDLPVGGRHRHRADVGRPSRHTVGSGVAIGPTVADSPVVGGSR